MAWSVKVSRTITGSSGAVASTDFPPATGRLICVALERPAAGAISSSNPIRIGRGSSNDLILENIVLTSTAIFSYYPLRMGCSTAGAAYASSDGSFATQIPFDDDRLAVSVNASTDTTSKSLHVHAWFDGAVQPCTS